MCISAPSPLTSKIEVEKDTALKVNTDAVSALQELCMARWWKTPEYHSWVRTTVGFQVDCSLRGYTVKGTDGFLCVFTLLLRVISNFNVKIENKCFYRRRMVEKGG